jgi:cell division protein FtsL
MSDSQQEGTAKRTIVPRIKIGPISLTFVTIILACLLCLFYLAQSNAVATTGYKIRELEQRRKELQEDNEKLQLEAARLQSIKEVEDTAEDLKMVPSKQVNYLSPPESMASK